MRFVFIVRTGPYAFEHLHTAIELTRAALEGGDQVGIFLAEDAVVAMNAECRTGDVANLTEALTELAERGVQIQGCGACCLFRGQTRSDLAAGLRMAGIASLAKMVTDADRALAFGY
ncbi:MAG: DsrE/DsrF/TusD sulfur relay family protein [Armatimonadota bacterium]